MLDGAPAYSSTGAFMCLTTPFSSSLTEALAVSERNAASIDIHSGGGQSTVAPDSYTFRMGHRWRKAESALMETCREVAGMYAALDGDILFR